MRNYRIRQTGIPARALLWDGRLSSAPTDYNVSVCDRTGDLFVEVPGGRELRVRVGEYFVDITQRLTLAMTPDTFHTSLTPTEET